MLVSLEHRKPARDEANEEGRKIQGLIGHDEGFVLFPKAMGSHPSIYHCRAMRSWVLHQHQKLVPLHTYPSLFPRVDRPGNRGPFFFYLEGEKETAREQLTSLVHCKIHTFTEGLPDPGNSSVSHVDPVLMELTVLSKEADVSKCLITAIQSD